MLSSGMITPPFFFSWKLHSLVIIILFLHFYITALTVFRSSLKKNRDSLLSFLDRYVVTISFSAFCNLLNKTSLWRNKNIGYLVLDRFNRRNTCTVHCKNIVLQIFRNVKLFCCTFSLQANDFYYEWFCVFIRVVCSVQISCRYTVYSYVTQ